MRSYHRPYGRIILLIIIFTLISSLISAEDRGALPKPVEFFAEEITLAVTDSDVTVTGIYHFRNNTSREGTYPVMFPFYVDSLCSYPDRIECSVVDSAVNKAPLETRQNKVRNSVIIPIPLSANAVTTWRLEYNQRIRGNLARYILTSTQSWGEPLDEATYEFVVPADFADVEMWPEADTMIEEEHYCRYRAHRENFMPIQDMVISWAPKKAN